MSAVDDGVARAAADGHPHVLADTFASTVLEWAESETLDSIVVPFAPVGPVREHIDALRSAVAAEAVAQSTLKLQWDTIAWPHASRGFVPFREQTPRLLSQHGL